MIYLTGSLRNPKIPVIARELRASLIEEVFDDWFSPGPTTDEEWQRHEIIRGRSYLEALKGHHARQVFDFDKTHLDRARAGILISPAGKSSHLELGYLIGKGVPGYVYMQDEPERWDVMLQFATRIFDKWKDLIECLRAT